MRRRLAVVLIIAITGMLPLVGCNGTSKVAYDSSEDCWNCGETPTHGYKVSGGTSYVCEKDSTTCMLCEENKAEVSYENMFGEMEFVCNDCYKEVQEAGEE